MKPKILFIKAKANNFIGQIQPPLGILYLSSYLKKHNYLNIELFEADKYQDDYEIRLKKTLQSYKPDIIGISAITAESISAHKIADIIKKFNKKITTIIGGPYPSHYPSYVAKDENIDFCVIGEGEITLLEIINYIEKTGTDIKEIDGIVYKNNSNIIINKPRQFINNLDEIPIPDWDLIDFDTYKNYIPQTPLLYGEKYGIILTSRGCPWHCTYCHSIFGKNFRAHSPNRVIEEIEILNKKYGIENIEITDDIFNLNLKRAKDILIKKINKLPNVKLFFVNGLRGDILDDELIELLRLSNTKYLTLALETGSEKIQKNIKKHINIKKLYKNTQKIIKNKIFTNMFVMFNFPGETVKDVLETIRWLLKIPVHTFMPSYLIIYSNTEISKCIPKEKILQPENDKYVYVSIKKFINYSRMKNWQLMILKTLSNILFYFLFPIRIYRIFRDMPYKNKKILNLLFKKLLNRTILIK